MPALKAFGRRWKVASDDFFFPALTELLFRLAWVVVVAVLIAVHISAGGLANSCALDRNLNIFYFWTLGLYLLHVLISISIAVVSARGTIMDDAPRSFLPWLLYLRLAMFFPEIGLNIFGSMWLFYPSATDECASFVKEAVFIAQALVVISWVMFLGSIILCLVIFDPLGGEPVTFEGHQSIKGSSHAKVWERRCRWLCFCFAGSQAEYTDIGNMLAEFFRDSDLVATDLAAGVALMAAQRQNDLDHKNHPPHYPMETIPNWMNLNNALHFMPYASAMYGWPFYIFSAGCTGCCGLCSTSVKNCCVPIVRNAPVTGDNCCKCSLATLQHNIEGIDLQNLVTMELKNRLYEVPFMVCADPQKKVIVVSLRGTLSLADAVTDITARAEPLTSNEIPSELANQECPPQLMWYAHKGMLMAARWVVRRLVDDGLLQGAFNLHPDCNQGVVVVGHSLGAGTAALVTILLKTRRDAVMEGKELRCFSYAPPGGLVSDELNKAVGQDIICAITLSGDLVPRLSLPNMLRLKADLIRALQMCPKSKHNVFGGILCSKACCAHLDSERTLGVEEGYEAEANVTYNERTHLVLPSSSSPSTDDNEPVTVASPCPGSLAAEPRLYPPGRVLTITEMTDSSSPTRYSATFCDPARCFTSIIIGTDMIRHHLPNTLHEALIANPSEWPTTPVVSPCANA